MQDIPAHLQQSMEEAELAQGVGNNPRAAGQTGSQHCFTETQIPILFVQKPLLPAVAKKTQLPETQKL